MVGNRASRSSLPDAVSGAGFRVGMPRPTDSACTLSARSAYRSGTGCWATNSWSVMSSPGRD